MMKALFGWLGIITPEKRAKSEVMSLDRLIYDAQKSLQSSQANLDYLQDRRDFLVQEYDMAEHPPSSRRMVHQVTNPTAPRIPQSMLDDAFVAMFNKSSRH